MKKKVWLIERDQQGDWSIASVRWLYEESVNGWKVQLIPWWPFGFWINKKSLGYRVEEL